jgi:hypothetical protein
MLAYTEQEQGKIVPKPKVKPVSAEDGYEKTGHRSLGRMFELELHYAAKRAAAAQAQPRI